MYPSRSFLPLGRQKIAWRVHSMHHRMLHLQKELKRTKKELELTNTQFSDAKWALHELSNGAANAAIQLYRAGELQARIDYKKRDRIGEFVWGAVAAMKSSQR